ncbi:MAG: hypothetical protein AAF939_21490, partial [Planctomycetota bacterium]
MSLFDNTILAPSSVWACTSVKIEELGLEMLRDPKEGATGFVLKANVKETDRVVAVKVVKNPDGSFKKSNGEVLPLMNYFRNERAMLCKLQDCDVVPRYHFSVEP